MLGCLSHCVVACTLRLTWPFLWSCGWSILYVSSVLLLHDSLHSLFTPVCLSVTRQGALHVLKGIPQLVIPSSQGWGVRSFHLDSTRFFFFFFWRLFVCYCFLSVRAQEKNTTSLVLWPLSTLLTLNSTLLNLSQVSNNEEQR